MDAQTSRYHDVYARWQGDPEGFWGEAASAIDWNEKPTTVFDEIPGPLRPLVSRRRRQHLPQRARPPRRRARRPGGADLRYPRHQYAKSFSYGRLLSEVQLLAAVLRDLGVGKGDRVILYMPMVPEAIVAMLASARIGAIHSVVFGGFAANELATRIDDAKPKVIVTASCGIEADPRRALQAAARRGDRPGEAQGRRPPDPAAPAVRGGD